MNYCFLARPALDKYCPLIFKEIKEKYDAKAIGVFITTNRSETSSVRHVVSNAIIYETSSYIRDHWSEFSFELFCEYEKKYDCAPLWKYVYTDRFLINQDYEYDIKITCGLFSFFEMIFNKHSIDIYYSETIATLHCYIAYLVGKKTGTKYYAQMGARGLDSTHHYVLDDPMQGIVGFNNEYLKVNNSTEEMKRADGFLAKFESSDVKPAYMIANGCNPKLRPRYVILPLLRLLKRFDSKYNDKCSYMYLKSYKRVTDPLKFYFRYQRCKKYYNRADFNRKYVYYPLHYQPEASTIVCAQKYEKQLFFIDSWAKSLPADTVLYVKEHYAILGHRDPQFYKELQKYPNVVLIDPWVSSKELSQNSVAVTTLTGTAGWEAMLMRKPVFIGGNIFFDNAPGVIKVDDIYGKYVQLINEWKQPTREDTIKYLCEYFRRIERGCSYGYKNSTDHDNIVLVTKSLMKHVNNDRRSEVNG